MRAIREYRVEGWFGQPLQHGWTAVAIGNGHTAVAAYWDAVLRLPRSIDTSTLPIHPKWAAKPLGRQLGTDYEHYSVVLYVR